MAKRQRRWYVGFLDDKMYVPRIQQHTLEVFTSLREARRAYKDVREVRIAVLSRPERKRRARRDTGEER